MKRYILLIISMLAAWSASAQYGYIQPRSDYRSAYIVSSHNISWCREANTDKQKVELYAEIATRITITTIVENMVIGTIEIDLGAKTSFSNKMLPWDDSLFKANVIYEIRDGSYKVTVSNILYKHAMDRDYSSIYSIIFNGSGQLRARGDADIKYFDNAFCDILLLE